MHKYLNYKGLTIHLKRDVMHFNLHELEKNPFHFFGENRFLAVNIVIKEYLEIKEISVLDDLLKNQAIEEVLSDLLEKIPSDAKIIDNLIKYDMIQSK